MARARTVKPVNHIFTKAEIAKARLSVDHVFNNAPDRRENMRRNAFTSGGWDSRFDPIEPQKEAAVRALLTREWFAKNGPTEPDLQPLPLGMNERERLKRGGAPHILAWYARSLSCLDYDIILHPSFQNYACGVMASELAPAFITCDVQLRLRFPPRLLLGLISGLIWEPQDVRTLNRASGGQQ
jgi:hypothetical protein